METILIIEDDPSISLGLEKNLKFEGYHVLLANNGEKGLQMAVDSRPDLLILDIMLPEINGFEICKILRKNKIEIPILIISAKDQEFDKIMGLDLGADDYVTKPFSIREMLARINAVFRRKRKYDDEKENLSFGAVVIDFVGREVLRNGEKQDISHTEFELLKLLIQNKNKVLDRKEILNKVWGYDYYGTARTIDNFITKLRQKIEDDPNDPRYILTVRGIGYKFVL
jgi:two-component system alkaline phosphatase synthesis response regulator PhoP